MAFSLRPRIRIFKDKPAASSAGQASGQVEVGSRPPRVVAPKPVKVVEPPAKKFTLEPRARAGARFHDSMASDATNAVNEDSKARPIWFLPGVDDHYGAAVKAGSNFTAHYPTGRGNEHFAELAEEINQHNADTDAYDRDKYALYDREQEFVRAWNAEERAKEEAHKLQNARDAPRDENKRITRAEAARMRERLQEMESRAAPPPTLTEDEKTEKAREARARLRAEIREKAIVNLTAAGRRASARVAVRKTGENTRKSLTELTQMLQQPPPTPPKKLSEKAVASGSGSTSRPVRTPGAPPVDSSGLGRTDAEVAQDRKDLAKRFPNASSETIGEMVLDNVYLDALGRPRTKKGFVSMEKYNLGR